VHTILDRSWTEPLPIYAFAIEHPEGVIVVDTGECARASQPGYFPRWHPVFRFAVREFVEPEQEIGPQLKQLGIERGDVRLVVMTHLHTDHAGGLHHFPDTEIVAARAEITYATGLQGQLRGYPNTRWPAWFDPTPVDLEPKPFGGFPQSLRITKAGDVTLVPVPGHSPGQLGVLVEDGDHTVFLAGDSSYTQELMLRGTVDGVGPDEAAERLTHQRIRAYVAAHPTVYLVAHDPDTAPRLAEPQGAGGMIVFQTSIAIKRPAEEVFAYVCDPRNLPAWNSAVQAVRPTSAATNGVGSTFSMKRELPTGTAINQLEVIASKPPREFTIRTTAGPTPFLYRYRFAAQNAETVVQLDAQVELDGAATRLAQLARRAVKKGVNDNLATLKVILEKRRRAR
jgi:glyoxylase-like metal-dependent hydrolase (beta-lactamase superfamily II)